MIAMNNNNENYYISLGAGVQSSALALMLDNNSINYPKPLFAIFADTQSEPQEVYDWLNWLKSILSYPIFICSKGNLYEASLKLHTSKTGSKYSKAVIPSYTIDGNSKGISLRQCTVDYKITEIKKELKKHLKLSYKNPVIQYIGISSDEATRMKDSRDRRIINEYPLVKLGINRQDCIKYIQEKYQKTPPRSACIFCPFHNDYEWKKLMQNERTRQDIIIYEQRMQELYKQIPTFRGVPYLHKSRKPIGTEPFLSNNYNLFENDCEGYCGV